jgi:DNA repair exonuclease SbcCD ATPase subunit
MSQEKQTDQPSIESYRDIQMEKDIDRLMKRLDSHFEAEESHLIDFSERISSIETNLGSVSSSMKKLAEILERLAIIEEKNRTHNKFLDEINNSITYLKTDKEETTARINTVDNKVNRWIYTATGITSTLIVIWTVLGGVILNKVSTMDQVIDQVKIHMAVGQVQQQQQELTAPSVKGK